MVVGRGARAKAGGGQARRQEKLSSSGARLGKTMTTKRNGADHGLGPNVLKLAWWAAFTSWACGSVPFGRAGPGILYSSGSFFFLPYLSVLEIRAKHYVC